MKATDDANVALTYIVPGTHLELHQSFRGKWLANYEVHVKGLKHRKNFGDGGDTPAEAICNARKVLDEYLESKHPILDVYE